MKKLQSNYTTIVQSKQLLELGVPADSADCYRREIDGNLSRIYERWTDAELHKNYFLRVANVHPCWSVGRLIEILNICSICGHVSIHRTDREVTQIEQLIEILQNRINDKTIDFSKFELY